MGPGGVLKVHQLLGCPQKVSQGAIGLVFGHRQLKEPHKALRIAVVSRRACSAHRADKAFLEQELSGLRGSILLALIGVKDGSRDLKRDHLDRRNYQFCWHAVVKGQSQDMPCALPQRKAATHTVSVCQTYFKDVREDDLRRTALLQ